MRDGQHARRTHSEDGQPHQGASQIALLSNASAALAEAKSLSDIKKIRDKAEAVRHYAKSIALGLELHNHAAEIKLRAERKAGELLSSLSLHGGDRRSSRHQDSLKLKDLGIDANKSARWQREATVPEQDFQRYINEANASGKEISTAGLLALARTFKPLRQYGKAGAMSAADGDRHIRGRTSEDVATVPSVEASDAAGACLVASESAPLRAFIQEAKDHASVLSQILTPVCTNGRGELTEAECRHVQRLLLEIQQMLDDLQSSVSAWRASTR